MNPYFMHIVRASEKPWYDQVTMRLVAIALCLPVLLIVNSALFGCKKQQPPSPAYQSLDDTNNWLTWKPPQVVMPENNADIYYVAAFRAYSKSPVIEAKPTMAAISARPTSELTEFIHTNADVYKNLDVALELPCRWAPVNVYTLLSPSFTWLTRAGYCLFVRSVLKERQGEDVAAAQDAIGCMAIGTDMLSRRDFAAVLYASLTYSVGSARLHQLMPELPQHSLGDLQSDVAKMCLDRRPSMLELLRGEIVLTKKYLQQVLKLSDDELREDLADDLPRGSVIDRAATWRTADRYFEAWAAQMTKPYQEREWPAPPTDPVLNACVVPIAQCWPNAIENGTEDLAQLRLALILLAAHSYEREHGRFPDETGKLVPNYLDAIPPDPFTGDPLKLAVREGKSVLYSVGPDGVDGTASKAQSDDDIIVELQL